MGTYESFTRAEFEEWLDTLSFPWKIKRGTLGVYVLKLSPLVGLEISSTLTSRMDTMGQGDAAIQMRLVSLPFGHVINKKSQGQAHFKRTLNWRGTLAKGVTRMRKAYLDAKDFYDVVASIEDRKQYTADWVKRIHAIPGYEENPFLQSVLDLLGRSGILTEKQVNAIEKMEHARNQRGPVGDPEMQEVDDGLLQRVRLLWKAAQGSRDVWTMEFAKTLGMALKAGQHLSPKQDAVLQRKLHEYGLSKQASGWVDGKWSTPIGEYLYDDGEKELRLDHKDWGFQDLKQNVSLAEAMAFAKHHLQNALQDERVEDKVEEQALTLAQQLHQHAKHFEEAESVADVLPQYRFILSQASQIGLLDDKLRRKVNTLNKQIGRLGGATVREEVAIMARVLRLIADAAA